MAPTTPAFHLIYWPGLPGRGEHIRLALEEAGASYTDTAHSPEGVQTVLGQIDPSNRGDAHFPPPLAPPILRDGERVLSQTANILMYLARLFPDRLAAGEEGGLWVVNGLVLTALDGLSDEVHDTHHPIASGLYYEDQKTEALRRAKDYLANRLPKFLGYFQRVLDGEASGEGPWLHGGKLTYADLVLFQCVDGLQYAFPKAMQKLRDSGEYDGVFGLHEAVRERPNIKAYLASGRRQKYDMGIYRYYPELDIVD